METIANVIEQPFQVKQPLIASLAITALVTISCVVGYFILPPQIPIFYSLPQASQQLADKIWISIFPVISLTVALSHTVLLGIYNRLDLMVLRVFGWMTTVFQLLLLAIVVRMMLLVL